MVLCITCTEPVGSTCVASRNVESNLVSVSVCDVEFFFEVFFGGVESFLVGSVFRVFGGSKTMYFHENLHSRSGFAAELCFSLVFHDRIMRFARVSGLEIERIRVFERFRTRFLVFLVFSSVFDMSH